MGESRLTHKEGSLPLSMSEGRGNVLVAGHGAALSQGLVDRREPDRGILYPGGVHAVSPGEGDEAPSLR